jgi:hypothetical protein
MIKIKTLKRQRRIKDNVMLRTMTGKRELNKIQKRRKK